VFGIQSNKRDLYRRLSCGIDTV